MRILAVYLEEDVEKKLDGKKKRLHCMPATDRAICMALEKKGHEVTRLAYDSEKLLSVAKDYDVIFNLCDGLEGDNEFIEFRVLQDIEKTGVPFTGNGLNAVKLCNDKRNIIELFVKNNINTPKYQVFVSPENHMRNDLTFPVIVKPVCADAAVGIYVDSVVHTEQDLKDKVKRVLEVHSQPAALVSEYIDGRDITIPVMGKKSVEVLYPTELRFLRSYDHKPKILSYSAKWNKRTKVYQDCITLVKNPEKRFSEEELVRIRSVARKVYEVAGCSGYATVDARIDKEGNIFVIEINPNCWIGKNSDTALTLRKNYGVEYPDFIDKLVRIALER